MVQEGVGTVSEDIQYQFLKTLCKLYDGGDYVPESKIREVWPDCPSHYEILDLGIEKYFDRNPDYQIHAYKPTGEGLAALREWKRTEETAEDLQKLRNDFDKYRAEQAAYQTAVASSSTTGLVLPSSSWV